MGVKKTRQLLGLLIFTLLIINFILIRGALAETTKPDYSPLIFKPQIEIPFSGMTSTTPVGSYDPVNGTMTSDLLPHYIKSIYDYGLAVAGILAAVILMGGGFLWLTSAGNESRVSKAKELITGGLNGLVLLFLSYLVLNAINPNLLEFRPIITQVLEKKVFDSGCCIINNKVSFSSKESCADLNGSYDKESLPNFNTNKCEKKGCCVLAGDAKKFGILTNENNCGNINIIAKGKGRSAKFFTATDCSTISDEVGNCESLDLGETPKSENLGWGNFNVYCYNGQAFAGNGQIGEPCGNEENSICHDDKNPNAAGKHCDGDSVGARNCVNKVTCCKTINGNIKYNE